MFPAATLGEEYCAPLGVAAFMSHVLMPEVATALVCKDMGIDREDAMRTLRESWNYGLGRYPV